MTVHIIHDAAGAEAAENLARAFEREGVFVDLADLAFGAPPPLTGKDIAIITWTETMAAHATSLQSLSRGLLIPLDEAAPPALPALKLMSLDEAAGGASAWAGAIEAAKALTQQAAPAPPAPEPSPARAPSNLGLVLFLVMLALIAGGLASAIWVELLPLPRLYAFIIAGAAALFALWALLAAVLNRRPAAKQPRQAKPKR